MNNNVNDSIAKSLIDSWYASNMTSVTNKIEDTIWCNDRSIAKYNGWSSTGSYGGSATEYSLLYGGYERSNLASSASTMKNKPSLICPNKNDSFTVSNTHGNQKLDYPVALLTSDEIVLAGGVENLASTYYLNVFNTYWTLSPREFNGMYARGFSMNGGNLNYGKIDNDYGYSPAISLKPGQLITKGTGTVADPYVIE